MKKLILALSLFACSTLTQAATLSRDFEPMPYSQERTYCGLELTSVRGHDIVFLSETGDGVAYDLVDFICPFLLTADKHKIEQTAKTFRLYLEGLDADNEWKYDLTFRLQKNGFFTLSHLRGSEIPQTKEFHDAWVTARNAILKTIKGE